MGRLQRVALEFHGVTIELGSDRLRARCDCCLQSGSEETLLQYRAASGISCVPKPQG